MKLFTWIGAAAIGALVAAVYWTNRQPDLAVTPPLELPMTTANAVQIQPPAARKHAAIEFMEPILVLPEWEVAPAPEPIIDVSIASENSPRRNTPMSPRPEAGRDSRLWMPYAAEDQELSATRRLEWAKLSTQDPVVASLESDFEETAEPPLLKVPNQ